MATGEPGETLGKPEESMQNSSNIASLYGKPPCWIDEGLALHAVWTTAMSTTVICCWTWTKPREESPSAPTEYVTQNIHLAEILLYEFSRVTRLMDVNDSRVSTSVLPGRTLPLPPGSLSRSPSHTLGRWWFTSVIHYYTLTLIVFGGNCCDLFIGNENKWRRRTGDIGFCC